MFWILNRNVDNIGFLISFVSEKQSIYCKTIFKFWCVEGVPGQDISLVKFSLL